MNYDAANYDFYDLADRPQRPAAVLTAYAVEAPIPERALSLATASFAGSGHALTEAQATFHAGADVFATRLAGRAASSEDAGRPWGGLKSCILARQEIHTGQKIVMYVTRQPEAPQRVLEWCRSSGHSHVAAMVSTTAALKPLAQEFGVKFHIGAEDEIHDPAFLPSIDASPDLIVLARYMRILPPAFVETYPSRIINVHHALLPSFIGADPYRRAIERGVRIMGATAHYVTDVLDDGPIIAQRAFPVDPAMGLADLRRHGADYEGEALLAAVKAHTEGRLLVYGNHVIEFSGCWAAITP